MDTKQSPESEKSNSQWERNALESSVKDIEFVCVGGLNLSSV